MNKYWLCEDNKAESKMHKLQPKFQQGVFLLAPAIKEQKDQKRTKKEKEKGSAMYIEWFIFDDLHVRNSRISFR